MVSRSITIQNSVGLHAGPAGFFVNRASSYKSSVWVEKDDCRVNAKSLLGVLSLGITKGTAIKIEADGSDEEAAVDTLADLIDLDAEVKRQEKKLEKLTNEKNSSITILCVVF